MVITKVLRGLIVTAAIVVATTVAVRGVRAQEEEGDAAKVKKHAVHASGPVVIASSPCATPTTAGVECYSITSSALKQGTTTGTLTGTLLVSTTTSKRGKATCYSVLSASTETVTVGTAVTNLDLSAGNACITTTKKGSTEILTPDAWTSATASPETGKGKETWKVVPTNATSTTSPLAGSGTVTLTGTVSP